MKVGYSSLSFSLISLYVTGSNLSLSCIRAWPLFWFGTIVFSEYIGARIGLKIIGDTTMAIHASNNHFAFK